MRKYIICFFTIACVAAAAFGYYQGYSGDVISHEEEKYIENEAQHVIAAQDTTMTTTQMILETYNEVTHASEKEVTRIPVDFLGISRTELVEKLNAYMDDMPLEEFENGLISYDLLYFSKDYIMLRKTYHPDEDFHKYFVKFSRGIVTVFYSDKETVYEYTEINLRDLPLTLRSEVISGKRIKDEKELYDFLENYSS